MRVDPAFPPRNLQVRTSLLLLILNEPLKASGKADNGVVRAAPWGRGTAKLARQRQRSLLCWRGCSLCAGWMKRTSFEEGMRRAGDVRNAADFKFRVRSHEYVQASRAKNTKMKKKTFSYMRRSAGKHTSWRLKGGCTKRLTHHSSRHVEKCYTTSCSSILDSLKIPL